MRDVAADNRVVAAPESCHSAMSVVGNNEAATCRLLLLFVVAVHSEVAVAVAEKRHRKIHFTSPIHCRRLGSANDATVRE